MITLYIFKLRRFLEFSKVTAGPRWNDPESTEIWKIDNLPVGFGIFFTACHFTLSSILFP